MENKKLQFIYFLKLIPELIDDNNWTEVENDIVERHFLRLKGLVKEGKVILAGRTLNTDPEGIVILEVDTEEEAINLMENDPAVKEKVMTAKLFPYRVALIRE
jgi:uncharacterized protein YciI